VRRWSVGVLVVAGVALAGANPAWAQTGVTGTTVPDVVTTTPVTAPPTTSTTAVTTPAAVGTPAPAPAVAQPAATPAVSSETLHAGIELGRLTARINAVTQARDAAQQDHDRMQAEIDQLSARLADAEARLGAIRDRILRSMLAIYHRNDSGPVAALSVPASEDFGSGRAYVNATVVVDQRLVRQLNDLQDGLAQDRARQSDLRDALQRTTNDLSVEKQRLEGLRGDQQGLLDQWGGLTILGPATLTAAQMAAWFDSTGVEAHLPPDTTVTDLAGLFLDEGRVHGVRGDVAFAQSIIETGSFTEYSYNNFSGIGWCDSCSTGHRFDTPRDGVRAQIQLLRNYADAAGRASDLSVSLEPALYGSDPVTAQRNYDTFFLKGKVPFWNQMGNGNWATDPFYAGKVLGVYARMLASVSRVSR